MTEATETAAPAVQVIKFTDRMPLIDRMNRVIEAAQTGRSDASIKDPATGISYNRHMVLPILPWKFSVTKSLSNPQSIPNNTFTQITFDGVAFDSTNGWDATNNRYVVPLSGIYLLAAQVQLSIPNTGIVITMFISIYVNGAEVYRGNGALFTQPAGGLAVTLSSSATSILSLFAGDTVAIYMWHNQGLAQNANGSRISNYFHGHLISG
ncbi:MAG: hypothetical protein M3082_06500 [Candidatus Dormibacteraeota bacterium]|nr:hypothetical protein [Candidatus Dormibacteraeota bacterium]